MHPTTGPTFFLTRLWNLKGSGKDVSRSRWLGKPHELESEKKGEKEKKTTVIVISYFALLFCLAPQVSHAPDFFSVVNANQYRFYARVLSSGG